MSESWGQPSYNSLYSLVKTRFADGLWEGVLDPGSGAFGHPDIAVTLDGRRCPGVTLSPIPETSQWFIEIPVPREALGDGIRTLVIRDALNNTVLESVPVIAGEGADADLRAEVALLRAEMELLKQVVRRQAVAHQP
ncbi:hypothetical protein [Cognatishimia sp. F0-27]|uniref:hypothetical protein n=1 Tax=Cognatishimia sp. F0-27 TaxID=2816855 RepID=UPI001D0C30DD|nr:hypothetical protein [Cognatishimia sp. F0-27]MCC1493023.1 hypothetical protein [Cognatishimia sp. F0-27]